jgi:hypothetical protein
LLSKGSGFRILGVGFSGEKRLPKSIHESKNHWIAAMEEIQFNSVFLLRFVR